MRHSQLEFDFSIADPVQGVPPAVVPSRRQRRGQVAYLSGLAAEASVEREYTRRGFRCLARRWRGPGGEIDLVFRDDDRIVFVEVKAGPTHDAAAERVSRRQADRIALSAQTYLDRLPCGGLTDMRIDVALVDRTGRVSVLENAFAGWW